jgi:hypothetical protein
MYIEAITCDVFHCLSIQYPRSSSSNETITTKQLINYGLQSEWQHYCVMTFSPRRHSHIRNEVNVSHSAVATPSSHSSMRPPLHHPLLRDLLFSSVTTARVPSTLESILSPIHYPSRHCFSLTSLKLPYVFSPSLLRLRAAPL